MVQQSWAERKMEMQGLKRCPACPGQRPVIGPDGPRNARVLFIGQEPGKEENGRGRPFIGNTGKEFNDYYLTLTPYTRDEIRITNMCKCMTGMNTDSEEYRRIVKECSEFHIAQEIHFQKPEVIVPMGAVACSMVGDGISLEMDHGKPFETTWFGHKCTIFPMFHPASGLHNADAMLPLSIDFTQLGRFLEGRYEPVVDEYPDPVYMDIGTVDEFDMVVESFRPDGWIDPDVAVDTEWDPDEGFYNASFSMLPGTGFMVRRSNDRVLDRFRQWLLNEKGKVVFHNLMADVPSLGQVDITIPSKRWDDTMMRAYHIQYLPQGLKALAYRLCGMVMEEFEDIVMPWAVELMLDFIIELTAKDWGKPEPTTKWDPKKAAFVPYKPQGLNLKFNRLISDFSKKPSHKIFDRWYKWSEEERLRVLKEYGDLPKPSIKHVPPERQVRYACRDADATIRVKKKLLRLRHFRKDRVFGRLPRTSVAIDSAERYG